jgi:hypothetical protein
MAPDKPLYASTTGRARRGRPTEHVIASRIALLVRRALVASYWYRTSLRRTGRWAT